MQVIQAQQHELEEKQCLLIEKQLVENKQALEEQQKALA